MTGMRERSIDEHPTLIGKLVDMLADISLTVRQSAVNALIAIGGIPVARSVISALASEQPSERNAACEMLRGLGHPAVGPLIESLQNPNADVKLFAIEALTALRSPDSARYLIPLIADPDLNIVTAVVVALGELRDVRTSSILIDTLGRDSWIDCAIARSLALIGGPESIVALRALLRHPDDCVVYCAIQGLSEITDSDEFFEFVPLMKHQNLLIAAGACEAAERSRVRIQGNITTRSYSLTGDHS